MIDQWFKHDLQDIYEQHTVAVFIDESGEFRVVGQDWNFSSVIFGLILTDK